MQALQEKPIDFDSIPGLPEYVRGYYNRMTRISELNEQLGDIDSEDPRAYEDIVRAIMDATQDYYKYLGDVPEKARNALLALAKYDPDDDVEQVGQHLQKILGFKPAIDRNTPLSFQSIRPKNYIMQIDAITNQLANLNAENRFKVGRRGNQPILTTVTLDMPDHMKIEGGGSLTTYDKSIINGVTSLLESGNTVFSIPMLYHAMTGRSNPTVDDNLYDEISGKLEKMRRMMLTIDLSEENEAHLITDASGDQVEVKDIELEGYLLPLNKISGVINGRRTELFQIIQHPPLYTYSKMRRQLASVKISLLGAPVNNNSTTIPLKTYLLQRIEMMKNQKNNIQHPVILYSSVYQELAASDANKTKKMRIRSYTTIILQYFVEQGYISGFAEYKSGRSIAGIRVEL